ncbi:MAG: hypothetical protein HZC25_04515 [Rhodospirillales bacterium]|nr:hypothetical protein [Rhodospirillales bacterium]
MRPLEMQVEISSHVWLLNRVKELLTREGLMPENASREEVRTALTAWVDFVAEAQTRCGEVQPH